MHEAEAAANRRWPCYATPGRRRGSGDRSNGRRGDAQRGGGASNARDNAPPVLSDAREMDRHRHHDGVHVREGVAYRQLIGPVFLCRREDARCSHRWATTYGDWRSKRAGRSIASRAWPDPSVTERVGRGCGCTPAMHMPGWAREWETYSGVAQGHRRGGRKEGSSATVQCQVMYCSRRRQANRHDPKRSSRPSHARKERRVKDDERLGQ